MLLRYRKFTSIEGERKHMADDEQQIARFLVNARKHRVHSKLDAK